MESLEELHLLQLPDSVHPLVHLENHHLVRWNVPHLGREGGREGGRERERERERAREREGRRSDDGSTGCDSNKVMLEHRPTQCSFPGLPPRLYLAAVEKSLQKQGYV